MEDFLPPRGRYRLGLILCGQLHLGVLGRSATSRPH